MGNENGREIRAQRKRRRKNSTVHGDCLCHTESQTTFWPKTYILLAGAISYSCATCGTHSTANQRALATTGQRPYQSASTGASADHLQVALLVRSALYEYAGRLHWHVLSIDGDARQGQPQVAGIVQAARRFGSHHATRHVCSTRNRCLPLNHDRFLDNALNHVAGMRCSADDG